MIDDSSLGKRWNSIIEEDCDLNITNWKLFNISYQGTIVTQMNLGYNHCD